MPTLVDTTTNVIDVTTGCRHRPPPAVDVPDTPAPEEEPERERELVFELRDLEVKYSGHTAVREVDLDIAANEITAFIGPSGCGKTTVLRCLNRMHDLTPGAEVIGQVNYHGESLYAAEGRRRRGAPAHRHGVPEAQPVPEDHLRQRRLRPEAQRPQALGDGRHRRAGADPRRAVGRGEGQAQEQRAVALRWSAAAPVHRPRARGRARRRADGRAVLGARPDRHRPHRGPHGGAQARVHDRDRHPQHAAGRADVRPHRVLHRRGRRRRASESVVSSSTTSPRSCSPRPPTPAPRVTSPGGSVERHEPPAARAPRTPRWNRRWPRPSEETETATVQHDRFRAVLDELRQARVGARCRRRRGVPQPRRRALPGGAALRRGRRRCARLAHLARAPG